MQALAPDRPADVAAGRAAACPSCAQAMQPHTLAAHYGRRVEVDVCAACHMLWFDGHESVHLAGRGVLALLRAIDASHGQAHQPLGARMACPRCSVPLQRAANLTATGPTAHHACPRGHGAAQFFSLYLAEKGFVRPLYRPEVEQLRLKPAQRQPFQCLNCGAPIDPRERDACAHCASPVRVIDVLQLLRAVDRQTGQLAHAAQPAAAGVRALACVHCGMPTDPARERRCGQCAMPIALTDLRQALVWLEPLVPAIESGQPTADHRRRRLDESHGKPFRPADASADRKRLLPSSWGIYVFCGAVILCLIALGRVMLRWDPGVR